MTILNLMLGKRRGGLEQAAIDYAEAMAAAHIPSLTLISPTAWVEAALVSASLAHQSLPNRGGWDIFAARRLRKLATEQKATAIICHGNRALKLALRALKSRVPILVVAHNYATEKFLLADHCFAITQHLSRYLYTIGARQVSIIPNMVRLPAIAPRPLLRTPPVIGTMGRLHHKKGFDIYLNALALLRDRGIEFHAILGGDGEEGSALQEQLVARDLTAHVTLTGWVTDKAAFFDQLDLFVLPSRHEAFGLVLIEAMVYGLPIVTTDAEGPREIAHHNRDALVVPKNNPAAMADALAELLANPARARQLGEAGRTLVREEYSLARMAGRLQEALAPYLHPHDDYPRD